MTRSNTRRAALAGWLEHVFVQDAQTKLLDRKSRAGAFFGAGLYFYGNTDAQGNADFQTDGFAPRD